MNPEIASVDLILYSIESTNISHDKRFTELKIHSEFYNEHFIIERRVSVTADD